MNEIMFRMLNVNPRLRPTCKEIFESEFFDGTNRNPNKDYLSEDAEQPLKNKYDKYKAELNKVTKSKDIVDVSVRIFDKYHEYCVENNISTEGKIYNMKITSFCIAYKLCTRFCYPDTKIVENFKVSPKEVKDMEKVICTSLDYKIY